MKLDGARVVITGGASGLGLATAARLKAAGSSLFLLDINGESLDHATAELTCKSVLVDVTDEAQVDEAIGRICSDHGCPHVLVNSAGILRSAPLLSLMNAEVPRHSFALWNQVMTTNLSSVFLVTRAITERMVRARVKGVVISLSSISANGNSGQSAYSAAKAGVEALTRVWAKELGPLGLRFVAIAPGYIDTPSTREAVPDDILETLRRETPLRRLGEPEHIAQAVQFAIENDMLTATTLEIDGGLLM